MTALSHDEYRAQARFPALDGLRAISVLLVITCHLTPHPVWTALNGELGVQIFFVLSGFLITTLALREESRFGRVGIRAFFVRRSFRIMPLYYLVLATYFALLVGAGLWPDKRAFSLDSLAAYLFYVQELPFLTEPGRMVFAHSWSLGIEEKFYLFWPLFAFVLVAARPRLRIASTAAIAALCAITPQVTWVYLHEWAWAGDCVFNYFTILVGCLLAFALHERQWCERARWLGSSRGIWVSVAGFLTVHLAFSSVERLRYIYPFATAALIAALVLQRSASWLTSKPLVVVGTVSYGVYLTHWLCIELVHAIVPSGLPAFYGAVLTLVLTAASSTLIAYGLHQAIERPLIALGRRIAARFSPRTEGSLHAHGSGRWRTLSITG